MWNYSLTPLQAKLLDQQIIDIAGEIDADMAVYIRTALVHLTAAGSPEIEIRITSSGGGITPGLDIYDMLKEYPALMTGLVIGHANSIATVILQACDERRCHPNSSFVIHNISRNIQFCSKADFLKQWENMKKLQLTINQIYARRSKQSLQVIEKISEASQTISASEAKKLGLIDSFLLL